MLHIEDYSPEKYFGFKIGTEGKMIDYAPLVEYFRTLERVSDKIKVESLGITDGGNDYVAVIVSNAENLKNIDKVAEITHSLADMKIYDEALAEELAEEGRAVVVNTMSVHSHEIGGGQTCPLIVYDLLTKNDRKTKCILENVVYVLFPSVNPDGQNIVYNFYKKYEGTEYEGTQCCCANYHKFACHGNNRDFFAEHFMETKGVNDFTYRRFHATACYDVHHMQETNHRFVLSSPAADPRREELSPLLTRELSYYGSSVLCAVEKAGCTDAVHSYWEFSDEGYWSIFQTPKFHNIVSILNENSHLDRGLYGRNITREDMPLAYKGEVPSATNPNPWKEGYWGPENIVKQIYTGVNAFLYEIAHNRADILKNTAIKASLQTKRGEESVEQGYLIPQNQRDSSSLKRFLKVLSNHRIEFLTLNDPFTSADGRVYPKGTVYVPLAQPNFALVSVLLKKRIVPDNRFTRNVDGYDYSNDGSYNMPSTASANLAEWMGVEVFPANKEIDVGITPVTKITEQVPTLPLSVNNSNAYALANERLYKGKKVYLNGDIICEDKGLEIKPLNIGLFMFRTFGADDSSFTNYTLHRHGFKYKILGGHEIREDGLEGLNVLVFPGQNRRMLEIDDYGSTTRVPENQHAMGQKTAEIIGEFVKQGGRVICWNASCQYFADYLNLPVRDIVTNLPRKEYQVHFSTLRVNKGEDDIFTTGVKNEETFVFGDSSVFEILDATSCKPLLYIAEKDILSSGLLVGEDIIKGKPCAVRVKYGKGEFIMYGFDPQLMSLTMPEFKLLFNGLYEIEQNGN